MRQARQRGAPQSRSIACMCDAAALPGTCLTSARMMQSGAAWVWVWVHGRTLGSAAVAHTTQLKGGCLGGGALALFVFFFIFEGRSTTRHPPGRPGLQ